MIGWYKELHAIMFAQFFRQFICAFGPTRVEDMTMSIGKWHLFLCSNHVDVGGHWSGKI